MPEELDADLLDLLKQIDQPVEDIQLCVGCNSPKPPSDFLQNQHGIMANCKACRQAYRREYMARRRKLLAKRQRDGDLPDSKTCVACKTEKPVSDFWKMTTSLDGRQCYCKECHLSRNRK